MDQFGLTPEAALAMPGGNFSGTAANPVGSFTTSSTTLPSGAGFGSDVPAGGGGFLNNIFGWFGSNPGLLLGAGALGADLLLGNKPLPAEQQVQTAALEQGTVGRTLAAYGTSGTLPAGLQDIVGMNQQAGEAAIRSQYGQLGLSGSTMEDQALQQVREASAAQTASLANQLLAQGAQWTGMSNQELNTLLQTQMQQDAALTQAIGSFAGGVAGMSLLPAMMQPVASAA